MNNRIDLSGIWLARWSDGQRGRTEYAEREIIDRSRYIEAVVPGEIHLDAWRAGMIAEPYIGTNCLSARWVEECIWSFRREFEVSAELCNCPTVWLVFESLDIAARIVLNGKEIGKHQNVFYPCRINVSGMLREGKNILTVHLDSGLYATAEKPITSYSKTICDHLAKRQWLRKPQCQFGWDWSSRLINLGISKSVYLEYSELSICVEQLTPLATVSDDLRRGKVQVKLFVENSSPIDIPVIIKAALVETTVSVTITAVIKPGGNQLQAELFIEAPELWWPVGHGSQRRYTLNIELLTATSVKVFERSVKIGFRHVRIDQSPHPEAGTYFIVEINGRRIFVKGGNFVPADMIFARIDRERSEALIRHALAANFNTLRVWGGGLYESDEFYELCDEHGILVWQEFIFACTRYPATDQTFYDDFKREATYNIRRLASHPSLIIWCGNNEMEWGSWEWGFDRGEVHPDHALFHLTIPRLLATEDPTRYYQPSSPFSPGGVTPNRDDTGDQHPWSIGFRNTDFREYRKMICRFPNEGGILGPTALPTMLACLPDGQRFHGSFAWQVHDNSVDSWSEPSPPDEMIRAWLKLEPKEMSIEDFTYWAGLLQGEGLREYSDNFRRRMFDSSAAVFWMYNDCWPATRSWTIIDYYLRRTPSFHPVRRAFAPVHVVVVEENGNIMIYGINETQVMIEAELLFGVFSFKGEYPVKQSVSVSLPLNSSTKLAEFTASQWEDRSNSMAFAVLMNNGVVVARNRLYTKLFCELNFEQVELNARIENGKAVFECDKFVWGVCLDLDGGSSLSDNFFDIYPGMPHLIDWNENGKLDVIHVGNELSRIHKTL
jgi:beta-mannosidase